MVQLPAVFTEKTRLLMGEERFERYLQSFEEDAPVSIRLNPMKASPNLSKGREFQVLDGERVPWCRHAYYLKQRPNFTMDPLFHAGCYYVQEASSMFLDEVLRQYSPLLLEGSGEALDMCAAPGGKSTLLRSALPKDCVLYSNEPIRNRANILLENVTKWGYENHLVTNNYPKDYRKSKLMFDLILCDVPCSGEGMFRKDEATIREWSEQNVEKCWQLQRDIVDDAWACLNAGGLLIYSTCTFNTKENEENIRYFLEQYDDMKVVPINIQPEWNITGSLLEGFHEPVYRFIPGISRGEGLFMCVLRKSLPPTPSKRRGRQEALNILTSPLRHQTSALSHHTSDIKVDLDYKSAISYLRGEALVLPEDTPRGEVTVCFQGHPLGPMKNIGTRANNLYPKEWRIRTTHIPNEYEAILRHTEQNTD